MNISIINLKNSSLLAATNKGSVDPFGNVFQLLEWSCVSLK